MGPGTTRTQVDTARPVGSMDHMGVLDSVRVTTPALGRIPVARLHMDHTVRAVLPKLITRALELMRRRDRVPVSMAVGDRQLCSAETIGLTPNDLLTAPATRLVSLAETRAR